MWISGTFKRNPCPLYPCNWVQPCQGHDGHADEMGDGVIFYQLVLDQTDEGIFRMRSQNPLVSRDMEFTIGRPFLYNGFLMLENDVTAEESEDGMVFSPADDSWKMSFDFDTQQQLTVRLEQNGGTGFFTFLLV